MSAAPVKPASTPASASTTLNHFSAQRLVLAGTLLLVGLVFAAYHNCLDVPFIFDDTESIVYNQSIRSFTTALTPPLQKGITVGGRPVLNFTFAINYALSGTELFGIHLGNILIHTLASLVLWSVVRRTLGSPGLAGRFSKNEIWLAWMIAALWAVHPLQTESVTYAVQRAESLVGLLYLLTLYCFIRYTAARSGLWFFATVIASLLGMGTKEVMATAPLILFIYDRTFVSGSFRQAWQRHGRLHLCVLSTLILLGLLVANAQSRGGTVGSTANVTWWGYVCTQAYAVARYAWLTLWPAGLTLDYGTLVVRNAAVVIPCGLIVIAALGATVWALVRKPMLGFLGAWFFVILAPSSSFIPVNTQTMAEHRVYLALAALICGAAIFAFRWFGQRSWILLTPIILLATGTTIARNAVYQSPVAIRRDTIAKCPTSHRVWISLGAYLLNTEKNPAAAITEMEHCLQLNPNQAEALNILGQARIKLGQQEAGMALIEKSLSLDPTNPKIHAGAGTALMDCELYEQALPHLEKSLVQNPADGTLNYNLATVLLRLGRVNEAEQHYLVTLAETPNEIDVLNNYGSLLYHLGRTDEAIEKYKRAIQSNPKSAKAYGNLGVAFVALGKLDDGLRYLRDSVRLDSQSYETRSNLCSALAQTGHIQEALPLCAALAQEKPDAELYNNLGSLYGQSGQLEKAEQAFHAALQLDPNNENALENYAKLRAYFEAQRQH